MAERHNRLFFVGSEGRCVCVWRETGERRDREEGGRGTEAYSSQDVSIKYDCLKDVWKLPCMSSLAQKQTRR